MEITKRQTAKKDEKMVSRREALSKTNCLVLSAATMMILMKSQPAKATSVANQSTMAKPNTAASTNETWRRTAR